MSFLSRNLTTLKKSVKFTIIRKLHNSKVEVGSKLTLTKIFTSDDVKVFANMIGDVNPIHLDKEYASKTKFKRPIVHGVLTNGLFSCLVYKLFGDGAVLLNINTDFLKPVFIGDEIRAESWVTEVDGLRVTAKLRCFSKADELLIEGTAKGSLSRHTLRSAS